MARLIDADKLEKDLMDMSHNELMPDYFRQMCMSMAERVSKEPTIEAEPVRHGYWKHETKENVWGNMVKIRRCSECGKYSYKNKAFEFDFPNCPCCRAIMDKEESK